MVTTRKNQFVSIRPLLVGAMPPRYSTNHLAWMYESNESRGGNPSASNALSPMLLRQVWIQTVYENSFVHSSHILQKGAGIVDTILAMATNEHNLHFHLTDTQNPKTSPDKWRSQFLKLCCYISEMISNSLFPTLPSPALQSPRNTTGLISPENFSALIPSAKDSKLRTGNIVLDLRKSNISALDSASTCPPKNRRDSLRG